MKEDNDNQDLSRRRLLNSTPLGILGISFFRGNTNESVISRQSEPNNIRKKTKTIATNSPVMEWQHAHGGTEFDVGTALIQTDDGGVPV